MTLVAFAAVDSGGTGPIGISGGWERIGRVTGPANILSAVDVYWKIASPFEPTAYTVTMASTADAVAVVAAISGAKQTVPTVASGVLYSATDTVVTPPADPPGPSGVELRWVGGIPGEGVNITWSVPSGFTPAEDLQSQDEVGGSLVWRMFSSDVPLPAQSHVASAFVQYGAGLTVLVESVEAQPPQPPVVQPYAPGRGSSLYRYVFTDMLSRQYLGDLDLVNVSFDKRILQAGSFSATIPIPNRKVGDQVAEIIPRDDTELGIGPGVITVQVYREGVCWGEYWITGAQPARSRKNTPAIAIRGSTLDAYLSRVELQDDLIFTGVDQINIARILLGHLAAQEHANLSLSLESGTSGIVRDRTYLDSEGATYGQRLLELAQVDDGFEWMINLETVAGSLSRRWVWGYPQIGTVDPPPHLFSDGRSGGDILEWQEEIDALRGGTRWRARGSLVGGDASTTSTPLTSTVHEATAHLAAGWPRIDRTLSYSTVNQAQTLEDYAAFWASRAGGALRVDQVTVTFGKNPSFSPNNLGDAARFFYDNEWYRGVWKTRRIIGIGVTPTSRSSGKEEARLVLEGQEAPGA